MTKPLSLLAWASLVSVGALLGILLGRSAIAEIDPIYFSVPPARFFADLTPQGYRGRAPAIDFPRDPWMDEIAVDQRSYCFDCEPRFADSSDLPPEQAYPVDQASDHYDPDPDPSLTGGGDGLVETYADPPVSQEEAYLPSKHPRADGGMEVIAEPDQEESAPISM